VNPGLQAALREYNAGRFFECHEALEELLDDTAEEDWNFILGLIQVAVGYHKLTAGHPGGEKMLAKGIAKLAPYPDDHQGLDLRRLRRGVEADVTRIAEARRDGVGVALEPPQLLPVAAPASR
jgi:predicted metal-dependent hydrolase